MEESFTGYSTVFGWDYWTVNQETKLRGLYKKNGGERFFSYERAYEEAKGKLADMEQHMKAEIENKAGPEPYMPGSNLDHENFSLDLGYFKKIFQENIPIANDLKMAGMMIVYAIQTYLFRVHMQQLCKDCKLKADDDASHNLHVRHTEGYCLLDYSLMSHT